MGLFDSLKEQFYASNSRRNSSQETPPPSGGNKRQDIKFPTRWINFTVFLAILAIALITSIIVVDETEQSVVQRFGSYNRTLEPGLSFKIPFGIERSTNVPTKIVQNMTFGFRTERADIVSLRASGDYRDESTMLTGDLNIASVEWVIQYRISNPKDWLFNVQQQNKTIRDVSISVINELVGDYYITDVLGNARTEIEETALVNLNEIFREYALGINVIAVQLQNIVPPEGPVQDAFEDVNKAIQDMNRLINEGREAYNNTIPKARGEAEGIVQEAQGYAAERVNQAEGDTARFISILNEYRSSPAITRERLYYETVEEVLANSENQETLFIDSTFENLLPLLPVGSNTTPLN